MRIGSLIRSVLLSVIAGTLCCAAHAELAAASAPSAPNTSRLAMCGQRSCMHAMLSIINADRATEHLPPLRLRRAQADGRSGCPGSYGHSVAMATSGSIWHVNAGFPAASFPHDLCVHYTAAGENVGESATGSVETDLRQLDRLMMQEPHGSSLCAQVTNHACNILNPAFRFVGIGVYVSSGTTWLTEDFTN